MHILFRQSCGVQCGLHIHFRQDKEKMIDKGSHFPDRKTVSSALSAILDTHMHISDLIYYTYEIDKLFTFSVYYHNAECRV